MSAMYSTTWPRMLCSSLACQGPDALLITGMSRPREPGCGNNVAQSRTPRFPSRQGTPRFPPDKAAWSLGMLLGVAHCTSPGFPGLSRFSRPRDVPKFSLVFPRIPRPRGTPRVLRFLKFPLDFPRISRPRGIFQSFPAFLVFPRISRPRGTFQVFADFSWISRPRVTPRVPRFSRFSLVFLRISKPRNSRTFQVFHPDLGVFSGTGIFPSTSRPRSNPRVPVVAKVSLFP